MKKKMNYRVQNNNKIMRSILMINGCRYTNRI